MPTEKKLDHIIELLESIDRHFSELGINNLPFNDRTLTLKEAAEYLRVSKHTVRKLAREGKLPARKIGRDWRLDFSLLQSYLAGYFEDDFVPVDDSGAVSRLRDALKPRSNVSWTSLDTERGLERLRNFRNKKK